MEALNSRARNQVLILIELEIIIPMHNIFFSQNVIEEDP